MAAGTVATIHAERGSGCLAADEEGGPGDLYFHHTSRAEGGFDRQHEDQRVSFEEGAGPRDCRRKRAANMNQLDEASLESSVSEATGVAPVRYVVRYLDAAEPKTEQVNAVDALSAVSSAVDGMPTGAQPHLSWARSFPSSTRSGVASDGGRQLAAIGALGVLSADALAVGFAGSIGWMATDGECGIAAAETLAIVLDLA